MAKNDPWLLKSIKFYNEGEKQKEFLDLMSKNTNFCNNSYVNNQNNYHYYKSYTKKQKN